MSGAYPYFKPCCRDPITMRITVLQQQIKTLKDEQPKIGEEVARELERIKHFLWHGNTFQALQRLEGLLIDLEFPEVPSTLTQKVAKGIGEFETYIRTMRSSSRTSANVTGTTS